MSNGFAKEQKSYNNKPLNYKDCKIILCLNKLIQSCHYIKIKRNNLVLLTKKRFIFGTYLVLILSGCGGGGSSSQPESPVIPPLPRKSINTSVKAVVLSSSESNSNLSLTTTTKDDLGRFSLDLNEGFELLELSATGHYRNEITGELSLKPIKLRAIVGESGEKVQIAYINLLTHITSNRIISL